MPVVGGSVARLVQYGQRSSLTTLESLGDPLSLQRIDQTSGVTDEQHPARSRSCADETQLQPAAELSNGCGGLGFEQPDSHQMGAELVELLLGAMRMPATVTETEPQPEIGAVGTGEQPAIAGKPSTILVVPQRNHGNGDIGVDVTTYRKSPQHPRGIDEPGRTPRDAGRPVGTDHEVGLERSSAIDLDSTLLDRSDPGVYFDCARGQCRTA